MADDGGRRGKAASRRRPQGGTGRVTPKGTAPKGQAARPKQPSGRYTPPAPKQVKVSPRWVPIVMFGLLGVGVLLIIANYLGLLPGGSDNVYLLVGLAAITAGFVTATQYH